MFLFSLAKQLAQAHRIPRKGDWLHSSHLIDS